MYNNIYYDHREDIIYVSDDKEGYLRKPNTPYVYRLTNKETDYVTMDGYNVEKTFYNNDINRLK